MELTALDLEILADRVASKLSERFEKVHEEMIEAAHEGGREGAEHYHDNREGGPDEFADLWERVLNRMLHKQGRGPCGDLNRIRALLKEAVDSP